jgi:ribonuclease Z
MQIVLLGTGNGKADPARFSPSNVVWGEGEPLLVDCGAGAVLRLRAAGIAPRTVKHVFLTHLHFDHYADLPYLAIEPILGEGDFGRGGLRVFGPPGTARLIAALENAYDIELDGFAALARAGDLRAAVRSNVVEIFDGWTATVAGMRVTARLVDHGVIRIPSFAFRFEDEAGKTAVFSGDTVPCDALVAFATEVDVLIHECNFPDAEVETRKRLGLPWYIHSSPSGVADVVRRAQPRRLVLNHLVGWNGFSHELVPYDWDRLAAETIAPALNGEVVVGHDLLQVTI